MDHPAAGYPGNDWAVLVAGVLGAPASQPSPDQVDPDPYAAEAVRVLSDVATSPPPRKVDLRPVLAWAARAPSVQEATEDLIALGSAIESHLALDPAAAARLFRAVSSVVGAAVESLAERLAEEALVDPLTGLGNRRALKLHLDTAFATARRSGEALSVVSVDLDGLKAINDTHGHTGGDEALVALARSLRGTLRDSDGIYRVGGDEFVLILSGAGKEEAATLMARVQAAGAPAFSWGMAPASLAATSPEAVVDAADRQLYESRRRSRRPPLGLRIVGGSHRLTRAGQWVLAKRRPAFPEAVPRTGSSVRSEVKPVSPRRARQLARLALIAASYYLTARMSLELSLVGQSVTPLWFPTGVALVAILAAGYGVWPAVAVAAFAVNLPISPSPAVALGIAVGNTAAPLVAAWLLQGTSFRRDIPTPRDAFLLVGAGVSAATVSASSGTSCLVLSGSVAASHFGSTWLVWWTGDAMGMFLVAPFLWSFGRGRPPLRWSRIAEAGGVLALLVGAVVLAVSLSEPVLFIVFPPLVLITWRFQQKGAARAGLIASTAVTLAVVSGDGIFAHARLASAMITLQSFNAVVAATTLFFAAAVAERNRALGRLRQIARVTQEAIIRPPAPFIGPVGLAARYESASDDAGIGGDLYETAFTPFGVRLVVGDVRGKGLEAVQTASRALRAFRRAVYGAPDLASLVGTVTRETALTLGEEEFITAIFVEISDSGELLVANLGHPAPLLLSDRGVRFVEPSRASLPLGWGLGPITVDSVALEPRDRLLLYTDGLSEGRGADGTFFPLESTASAILATADLEAALDQLMASYHAHVGGRVPDDVAVLLAAWLPDHRPADPPGG